MITAKLPVDNYQNKPFHRKYFGSCTFILHENDRKNHLTKGQQPPKHNTATFYAVLKHMPQLSLFTLRCFTLQNGLFCINLELSEEIKAVALLKMYAKVKTNSYGHIRMQINV